MIRFPTFCRFDKHSFPGLDCLNVKRHSKMTQKKIYFKTIMKAHVLTSLMTRTPFFLKMLFTTRNIKLTQGSNDCSLDGRGGKRGSGYWNVCSSCSGCVFSKSCNYGNVCVLWEISLGDQANRPFQTRAWSCITSCPLRGLPYLPYDNVNPAIENGMMLRSSMLAFEKVCDVIKQN